MTVTPVNDAPEAAEKQPIGAVEDESGTGQIVATDVNIETSGGSDKLTYTVKEGEAPKHGALELNPDTGSYTYKPNENFNGKDQFVVVITDKEGASVEVTVPVTVTPVNDAPEAAENQPIETAEDETVTGQIIATDVDIETNGDKLTYTVKEGEAPKHGALELNPDTGSYT
ncbi:Ig-like domain-containing protein, partial [Tsukamurella conjunctivitidis]|uniref:Ig-like domain-containing protein n=1 Tax=Tsukamurella conjunctivitidis TaxID=2592068 RepID=UPI001E494A22